jgi:hypothetical protein
MVGFIKPQADEAGDLLPKFVADLNNSRLFINANIDIVQKSATESEGKTFKINFEIP